MSLVNPNPTIRRVIAGGAATALLLFAAGGLVVAGEPSEAVFAARAEAEYHRAQQQFQLHSNETAAAWRFARACTDLNDFVTNNAGRADLASQGITACRHLLACDSNSAPGHYYLAIDLGLLADTKRNLAAIRMVREMEREFKTADDLDAHFDYAGPARCLGLLYRDAPGWPLSIGNRHKAREWLEQAVQLAPDYPENRLILAETCWQWADREAARNELKRLDALWLAAQTNFTGTAWEYSWSVWTARREAVRQELQETAAPARPPRSGR